MHDDVTQLQRIMDCSSTLFRSLHTGQDQAWLSVELTMPQLKALMCVSEHNGVTHGQIARSLGVTLSTITGIVDRLVDHGFVVRREDPDDRRITRVLPTPRGAELVNMLLRYRNEQWTALLSQLTLDELTTVEKAFEYLLSASSRLADQARPREVVA
ncbi:MAG: MarR family transcriptional regulator [Chloroflexi bacterium]|nr:MarR family transcriptional regulator [Chloroflexota bacterium]MBV9545313.1 MarR family transcriptional regulator [Chloroflexota bacterium]